MRKVVVYELLSLDGVAEKPDGFFADWDDAMEANLGAVIAAQDSVILGRRSYEEWAEFWPGSDIEPFATFINGVAKYVATSTPLDRKWPTRPWSTANWSSSCGISGTSPEAISACMQASRSPRRCLPRASSTSSGW